MDFHSRYTGPELPAAEWDDLVDDTYEWWMTGEKATTTQYFTTLENALIDLRDFDEDPEMFKAGAAKIRDLITGEVMDMRAWLDSHR